MKLSTLLYLLILTVMFACDNILSEKAEENSIINNYDYFVRDFQERYGLFNVKDLDWSETAKRYREILVSNPTETELMNSLTALIDELDDSHTSLSHPTGAFPSYEGGIYGRLERQDFLDFDFELVQNKYLDEIEGLQETIYYGFVADDIGYIYLPEIKDEPDFYKSYLPKVLTDFENTRGLIIDIRNNDGGEDEGGRAFAGFFTSGETLFMISRYKTGPKPEDFENPREWILKPVGSEQYLKPIVLLTNRYTISAAETFSLAMKTIPGVIHVGDTTTGAFSDAVSRQLPNGWGYSLSVGDYRDGKNFSHESIGLVPDVLVENSKEELQAGTDMALERAIEILND